MKHTKKLLAAVMALTMVSAVAPMSAFADTEVKQNSTEQSGEMKATYEVEAKYTVTIPAGVTLDSKNSVSKKIEASDVLLESGQKIKVSLTKASNTPEGSSFSAKTDEGDSTATYTIGKGEATSGISVGDTVAEFTAEGTQTLTFSKAEGATYAGTHTETLTFGIAVEDASITFTVKRVGGSSPNFADGTYTVAPGTTWQQFIASGDAPSCLSIVSGRVCHDMNMSIMDCGGTPIANTADKKHVKPNDVIIDGATYGCSDYLGYQDHD